MRPALGGEADWIASLPALRDEARRAVRSKIHSRYRFGDAVVEVASDDAPLAAELSAVYGDCEVSVGETTCRAELECHITRVGPGRLCALAFAGENLPHPVKVALGPYRFLGERPLIERAAPAQGWRMLARAGPGTQALIASDGETALIDLELAPPEFVLDCIVGMAQAQQRGVMFLHAASVGIDGKGALILAPTFGGKSTTSLMLASRGHAFLGDDVAAVRSHSRELLPFAKSAGVRDGPVLELLGERLNACLQEPVAGRHGKARRLVRVGELFPDSRSGPLPLRYTFVLGPIDARASVTRFQVDSAYLMRLRDMVVMDTHSVWGMSPGRDLMLLLQVLELLKDTACYEVTRGGPEDTAALIEQTVHTRDGDRALAWRATG